MRNSAKFRNDDGTQELQNDMMVTRLLLRMLTHTNRPTQQHVSRNQTRSPEPFPNTV